jgi:hypothetical protein
VANYEKCNGLSFFASGPFLSVAFQARTLCLVSHFPKDFPQLNNENILGKDFLLSVGFDLPSFVCSGSYLASPVVL